MPLRSTTPSLGLHSWGRSFTIPLSLFEQSTSAFEYRGAEAAANKINENKTSTKLRTLMLSPLIGHRMGFITVH
jgi:hypothetical protein